MGDHSALGTESLSHMLSQKQEKVIGKNIFGAWTSQGKNYILWRKIICHNGICKNGSFGRLQEEPLSNVNGELFHNNLVICFQMST